MGPFVISLMLSAGVAGWVWAKVSRGTGNADPKSTALTAAAVFAAVFVIAFTFLKYVIHI